MTKIEHWSSADPKDIEAHMPAEDLAKILSKYERFDNPIKDQIYRIQKYTSPEWWNKVMESVSDTTKEDLTDFLTIWKEQLDANSKT